MAYDSRLADCEDLLRMATEAADKLDIQLAKALADLNDAERARIDQERRIRDVITSARAYANDLESRGGVAADVTEWADRFEAALNGGEPHA